MVTKLDIQAVLFNWRKDSEAVSNERKIGTVFVIAENCCHECVDCWENAENIEQTWVRAGTTGRQTLFLTRSPST